MPEKQHIMLDLETMGTSAEAAIVAIGAVRFIPGAGTMDEDQFYTQVDLTSSMVHGMRVDGDTIKWWLSMDEDARREICGSRASTIKGALFDFSSWLGHDRETILWGNGCDFDNVILASAYRLCGLVQPWDWTNNRCYRTVAAMFPHIKKRQPGTKHNALDDARNQARHLLDIMRVV